MTSTMTSRNYCFTLNNSTEDEEELLRTLFEVSDRVRYICWGHEGLSLGSTPHLQGYIELNTPMRITGVRRLQGMQRAHFEARRGSQAQARDYTRKEGGVWVEYGSLGQQGRRSDIQAAVSAIEDGANLGDLWQNHAETMIRYERGLRSMLMHRRQREMVIPEGEQRWEINEVWTSLIIWGDAGIGKTVFAKQLLPNALFVSHLDTLLEYDEDRYEGIIFDDMSFSHLPRTSQIHLVDYDDHRSIHCRFRCAEIPRNTKKIFTTNAVGGLIFDLNDNAIFRRITVQRLQ